MPLSKIVMVGSIYSRRFTVILCGVHPDPISPWGITGTLEDEVKCASFVVGEGIELVLTMTSFLARS
jgi:hypothetical protein